MKNLLLILSCLLLLSSSLMAQEKTMAETADADTKKGYQVGDAIEDFELKNIDGNMVSLKNIEEAKGYIVVFSCNHCPYVVAYEDRMIDLHKKYAPQGYPIVAINPNDLERVPGDSFEAMQERAKEKSFPFYYLRDDDQSIAQRFGATRTPHVYLVQNEADKMVVKYIGAIDDSAFDAEVVEEKYLETALDAVMKGEAPDPNFTKAIGCTIKWAE